MELTVMPIILNIEIQLLVGLRTKTKPTCLFLFNWFEAYTNSFGGFDKIYLSRAHCELLNINSINLFSKL